MKIVKQSLVMLLLIALGFTACKSKSPYERLVEKELASNVRQDSLFLGIHFQMPHKEFFTHCWELNKKGLLTNGPSNLSIKHIFGSDGPLKFRASMQFYPKFTEQGIYEMPVEFKYEDWTLWNKEMSAEVLLEDVKGLLERWYGGREFMTVESSDGTMSILVKVDGNRRIRLWRENVSTVKAVFTDLVELEKASGNS